MKNISCIIKVHPAWETEGGNGWQYWPTSPPIRRESFEGTFGQIGARIRAIVDEAHHHCAIFADLPRGTRKPLGWNKWIDEHTGFVRYDGPDAIIPPDQPNV